MLLKKKSYNVNVILSREKIGEVTMIYSTIQIAVFPIIRSLSVYTHILKKSITDK